MTPSPSSDTVVVFRLVRAAMSNTVPGLASSEYPELTTHLQWLS
jgi:hypothetical protein